MKDIFGYENEYAITSCGKVWSYKRQKFLKPRLTKKGYYKVGLSKDSKFKNHFVHRLVAEAYLPNPDNLPQVNHKDECKTNNYSSNLEWCSGDYNVKYGTRTARTRKPIYCVELDKTFTGIRVAARELNISSGTITSCVKGYSKTAGGYHWKYCEE